MKGLLKRILIPALTNPPLSSFGEWVSGNALPVFMLHRIHGEGLPYGGVSKSHLKRCLQYLHENGHNFVSLEDAIRAYSNNTDLPRKSVVFTIDDGYMDQATEAIPIFLEYDCPVTLFSITGMLDSNLWPWDARVAHLVHTANRNAISFDIEGVIIDCKMDTLENRQYTRRKLIQAIKQVPQDDIDTVVENFSMAVDSPLPTSTPDYFQPMTWDLARELERRGALFAPHSVTHRILSKLTDQDSYTEITTSWQRMTQELKSPSPVFCYPTGRAADFGPREMKYIKEAGMIGAVSTEPAQWRSSNITEQHLYSIPRIPIPNCPLDFIQYCTWIENAKSKFRRQSIDQVSYQV